MNNFAGGVAVITGGASGLGKQFAQQCAELGMHLMLADVQQDALDATVAELRAKVAAQGTQVQGMRVDVADIAQVQALAAQTKATFGTVNLVFNNAGVGSGGLVWENTPQDWQWVLGVNLNGVIHGVHAFTPWMLELARQDPDYQGHIVNTASMAGLITAPSMGVYCVSKHAVVALTESLHHDLALVTDQVHCSVLCPSYVATAIADSGRNRPAALVNTAPPSKSQLLAKARSGESVSAGDATPERVGEATFDAIRQQRFYIYPHPEALPLAQRRFGTMVAQGNPSDPFEGIPSMAERRAQMVAALRD